MKKGGGMERDREKERERETERLREGYMRLKKDQRETVAGFQDEERHHEPRNARSF